MFFEALDFRADIAWAPQSTSTEVLTALVAPPSSAYFDDSRAVRGAPIARIRSRESNVTAGIAPPSYYFEDSSSRLPLPVELARSQAFEQLTALAVAAPSPVGPPWDSVYPRQIVATAPMVEPVDVLLALPMLQVLGPFGEWIDSSAPLYGYTAAFITQADAWAALTPPPPIGQYFEDSAAVRGAILARRRSHVSEIARLEIPPPPLPFFDMADLPARASFRIQIGRSLGTDDHISEPIVVAGANFHLAGPGRTSFSRARLRTSR